MKSPMGKPYPSTGNILREINLTLQQVLCIDNCCTVEVRVMNPIGKPSCLHELCIEYYCTVELGVKSPMS